MKIEEFEKELLYFARNSEEKIIATNVAYYLGLTSEESKKHLQTLADKAILMLDSDDDGNLYYTMPNVPRVSNPEALKNYFFPEKNAPTKAVAKSRSSSERKCPYCMEVINLNAKKCKHCGEIVDIVLIKQQGGLASQKRNFPHLIHLALTILSSGGWLIIWLLLYIFRDKNKYV